MRIEVKGGGLTVGKSKITNGRGSFTGAVSVNELLGTYASVGAHAGAVKSSNAQVMTKGDISLALSGTGKGWDLAWTAPPSPSAGADNKKGTEGLSRFCLKGAKAT